MKPRTPIDVPKLLAWLNIETRKRGLEHWACCPIHGEKEPSFQIKDDPESREHGLWRCFGCGAKGNPSQLASELIGVDYRTAKQMLTDYGMYGEAPPIPTNVLIETNVPRHGFEMPTGVEFPQFDQWLSSPKKYILDRGITPEQVDRWGVGYAANGLLGGRIVFPVRDFRNRLCGYSARTFVGSMRRYLEPTVHDGYDPGVMFGEQHWPTPDVRHTIVLTEGAINALAVERALNACPEFEWVVPPIGAVRGSQLHPGHVSSLSTYRRVLVASDPDQAGDKLYKAVVDALRGHVTVMRVVLPSKSDAADLSRNDLVEAIVTCLIGSPS